MYLQKIIGTKEDILEAAMRHPALSPKRNPTIENALKVVVNEIERAAIIHLTAVLTPVIADMYDMYEIENGTYDDLEAEQRDDWESGLDDKVEEVVSPYERHLSADWLAKNTIDTRLFEEGAAEALVKSCAKEIVKQLCAISTDELKQGLTEKSPAQILSNAGIFQTDVQIYLDQHTAPRTADQEKAMAEDAENDIDGVLKKVRAHVGTGFDMVEVYSNFELALDDDDILAYGAGARLGLSEDDVEVIRLLALTHGDDSANQLMSMLEDVASEKKATRKKADKAPKEPDAAPAIAGDAARVLSLLKEHSAVQDAALATSLGFSRATFNNYLNGKSPFKPDEVQKEVLRSTVLASLNAMYEALCIVDGADVDRTFE